MLTLACVAPASAQSSSTSSPAEVRLADRKFVVDGAPFLVRGIHYGPWRPGRGPNKSYEYPDLAGIEDDFKTIRQAQANTVLIYDAPLEVLDLAAKHDLKVIYCFALWWPLVGGDTQAEIRARLVERVSEVRSHPALLAWLLGNEIGGSALQTTGETTILAGLRDLYTAVKQADPTHPISHANWPPARHLDLSFLDFASFNVYPLWPPEVVALGFGRYIDMVLRPIAGDKPLLISEFGVNTIEAGTDGQSRLLQQSWRELLLAGAAGGVVFEFADEWWKNYDNPTRPGDWWTRVHAPNDEQSHDNDPEEHYGLVQADRTPKPSFAVVSTMFGEDGTRRSAQRMGLIVIVGIITASTGGWLWARTVRRRSRLQPPPL
jgi:hypothetical protein